MSEAENLPVDDVAGDEPPAPAPKWRDIDWGAEEAEAAKNGWKPLEDWIAAGHDPDEHVDPRVYNARGQVIRRNKALDRQVSDMQRQLQEVAQQSAEVMRMQATRLRAEFEARRDEAIEAGDKVLVRKIDEQIAAIPEPKATATAVNDVDAEVREWVSEHVHDVFAHPERAAVVQAIDAAFGPRRTGNARADLDAILAEAKASRPDLFGAPKPRAGVGTGAPPRSNRQVGVRLNDLSASEQAAVEKMAKLAGMKVDDYMKAYNGVAK